MTRVRVERRSCDQRRRKSDLFFLGYAGDQLQVLN